VKFTKKWGFIGDFAKTFYNHESINIIKPYIVKNTTDQIMSDLIEGKGYLEIKHECEPDIIQTIFKNFNVSRSIQSAIDAGDTHSIIKLLGGESDNVISLDNTNETKNVLYDAYMKNKIYNKRKLEADKARYEVRRRTEKLASIQVQIDEINQEINIFEKRYNNILDEDICCICLDNKIQAVFTCTHLACLVCLSHLKKCHMCRKPIDIKKITFIQSEDKVKIVHKHKHRNDIILNICLQQNKKILIFTDYLEAVSIQKLKMLLSENNITFQSLCGSSNIRAKHLKNFRKSDLNVLFLNTFENGAGVHLPETSDLVLYHSNFRIQTKDQIIARAHRPPRITQLVVHEFNFVF